MRVRGDKGVLSRTQRRWAWIGMLTLAANAPFVALRMPDDTWMLSIVVALLVAMVILVDDRDRQRQRQRREAVAGLPHDKTPHDHMAHMAREPAGEGER
jgi:hypothetical protein